MKNMNRLVVAMLLGTAAAASVAVVRVNATRPGNWSSASAPALVPLNVNGATTIAFNSAAAGRRVLTYSAECSVDAPAGNNFAWLDLDVIVNGAVVPPTVGSADAFCSADGVAGYGGYTRSSITVVISVVEGTNRIRIQARGNAGATGVWLGDSALVVHD
jgi:hypothetical protein